MKELKKVLLALFLILIKFDGGYAYETIRISSDVSLEKYSTDLIGYLTKPEGDGPFPTIVMMPGCGETKESMFIGFKDHARFFNDSGFTTVILDSFSSRGINDNSSCYEYDAAMAALYFRTLDAFNALMYLKQQSYVDMNNIFLVGQSQGGSVAIQVAKGGACFNYPDDLKYTAVVAYYPWCNVSIDYLVSPLLVLSGEKDDWTPPDGCVYQEDSVKGEDFEVVVYPEAYHCFDRPISRTEYLGHTLEGHTQATVDSRERMLELFKERMTP